VVAVAPFDAISGISATDANMITRVFFIRLGNTGKVSLVDRGVVERVLKEHDFQTGDWSNQQKTAELGSALNADWIVRGEMEKFGSTILVTIQFYDIKTFRFMGGADLRLANADEAYNKMDPLVDKLIETIANTGTRVPGAAGKTYKIGDRGPAGGWIFYDKGVFSNGWRYLEAAPVETEFTAQWGAYEKKVEGTSRAVGTGKRNTELIVAYLRRTREANRAAQLCDSLVFDGFGDWFLPSRDELDLMYKNLKAKGLGEFGNTAHWSSSEDGPRHALTPMFNNSQVNPKTYTFCVRAVRAF
jgi:TolB-like protein